MVGATFSILDYGLAREVWGTSAGLSGGAGTRAGGLAGSELAGGLLSVRAWKAAAVKKGLGLRVLGFEGLGKLFAFISAGSVKCFVLKLRAQED